MFCCKVGGSLLVVVCIDLLLCGAFLRGGFGLLVLVLLLICWFVRLDYVVCFNCYLL